MQSRELTPHRTIADQPDEADLRALPAAGYRGVVNLRHDGEPEQPLGTAAEGEIVRGLGLDYHHLAVGGGPLTAEGVAGVRAFLDRHADGKVLLHCRKGARAAALLLIDRAEAEGWPAAEAIDRGRLMGLAVDGGLRALVEDYLRGREHA